MRVRTHDYTVYGISAVEQCVVYLTYDPKKIWPLQYIAMCCDGQVFYGSGISYSWALPEIKPFDFELFSYSAVYHSTLVAFFELWIGTPKLLPLSVSTNIKEWLPNENQGRGTYNELLKENFLLLKQIIMILKNMRNLN